MPKFSLHPQLQKDSHFVADLALCSVLMINDETYPWLVLVPRVADIKEVIDLSEAQQSQLWQESALVSHVLTQLFTPDKLNVAALGNMVPQLHIHHIARFVNDVAWPKPIWGVSPAKAYSEALKIERIERIKQQIKIRINT